MPVFDTSRATRLSEKLAERLSRKKEWAKKDAEAPFGTAKSAMAQVVAAYRAARSPEERQAIIAANGAAYMTRALRQHSQLPGLEDDEA